MKFDLDATKRKMLVKYPYFGSVIANSKYQKNEQIPTAATDGITIYYNPKFFEKLDKDEQAFVLAHVVCHIAFEHIPRSEGKNPKLWNLSTDAIINANLKKDGMKVIKGAVEIEGAINYDAETLYEKLLKEQQSQQNQQQDKQNQQGGSSGEGEEQENQQGGSSGEGQDQENQQGGSFGEGEDQENQQDGSSGEGENQEKQQGGSSSEGEDQQEQQDEKGKSKAGQGNQNETDENQNEDNQNVRHDSHDLWEEAVKKLKEQKEEQNKDQKGKNKTENKNSKENQEKINEKDAFQKNLEEKKKELEKLKEELIKATSNKPGTSSNGNLRNVDGKGHSKELLDWRYVLREAVQYDVDWSSRNAYVEDGVVCSTLEEIPTPEAEILLDTSGSISESLLRNFLRECKNILQHSRVKVGCFDTRFYGFTEIRTEEDIEKMQFRGGGGTDFNVAVNAFTSRVENKIIFTDGYAYMPEKAMDAVWIVFGEDEIKPKGGRVIYVSEEMLDRLRNGRQNVKRLIRK